MTGILPTAATSRRRVSVRTRRATIATLALGLGMSGAACAADIRIAAQDCSSGVRIKATDAPLSEVLSRLARTLDFQVSFEAENDPLVTIDTMRQPTDLVALLAPTSNVSIAQTRNPRCPGQPRIAKLWILRNGPGGVVRTAAVGASAAKPVTPQSAVADQGIDTILRAHGIDPAPLRAQWEAAH